MQHDTLCCSLHHWHLFRRNSLASSARELLTSRALSGVSTSSSGRPRSAAAAATGDGLGALPLPRRLPGCVTTAATCRGGEAPEHATRLDLHLWIILAHPQSHLWRVRERLNITNLHIFISAELATQYPISTHCGESCVCSGCALNTDKTLRQHPAADCNISAAMSGRYQGTECSSGDAVPTSKSEPGASAASSSCCSTLAATSGVPRNTSLLRPPAAPDAAATAVRALKALMRLLGRQQLAAPNAGSPRHLSRPCTLLRGCCACSGVPKGVAKGKIADSGLVADDECLQSCLKCCTGHRSAAEASCWCMTAVNCGARMGCLSILIDEWSRSKLQDRIMTRTGNHRKRAVSHRCVYRACNAADCWSIGRVWTRRKCAISSHTAARHALHYRCIVSQIREVLQA